MQQITERIYIGHSQTPSLDSVEGMLNVALDLDRHFVGWKGEYAKVGLVDGPGNHHGALMAAVLMLHQLLERKGRVMVFCHMGVSRSPTVVALYLAARSSTMTIEDSLRLVKGKHARTDPVPELIALAKIVLPRLRSIIQ